jgi:hypothetical protein
MVSQLSVGQKDRHQVIAALADLTSRLFDPGGRSNSPMYGHLKIPQVTIAG